MKAEEALAQEFGEIAEVVRAHADEQPEKLAIVDPSGTLTYRELGSLMDRVGAALQRDGLCPGHVAAICGASSARYGAVFLGILRASGVVAPLATSSTAETLSAQLSDSRAQFLFDDADVAARLAQGTESPRIPTISLDDTGTMPLADWLAPLGAAPNHRPADPGHGFNIIYSSGTTGEPKGIVQQHGMRWSQIRRGSFTRDSVTLVSTPMYSNTTLLGFLPTIAHGGTVVLMPKFDVRTFLELSQQHRVTHALLVPIQYRRVLDDPDFGNYNLSSYRMKYSTSAAFPPDLKRQVLNRWPGGLIDYYGMTEGGGTCALLCHEFPHKLHTVGRPLPGHDIRIINARGNELARGEVGEIVGHSASMMAGYHNQPLKTSDAEWINSDGQRFIRTGDIGHFDEDGFLVLRDRRKDMIISGGFNIYPSDIEAQILQHEAVLEAAVVGTPSTRWGESPVAFVVLRQGAHIAASELKAWVNDRVGRTQRLEDLRIAETLPRSPIGKVLKRQLRDEYLVS